MRNNLFKDGFFDDDIDKILDVAKKDPLLMAMSGRWDDNVSAHPQPAIKSAWRSVRLVTLKWIDKNKPNAWNRPLFES